MKALSALLGKVLVLALVLGAPSPLAAQDGEAIFKTTCTACHGIGKGRMVGPDLAGVTERRDESWLKSFIRGPQRMKDSGDAAAVALFKEYVTPMPDQALSDAQITDVLTFIKERTASGKPYPEAAAPLRATETEVQRGRKFFEGRLALSNGGPACNSCHHISDAGVQGGAALAVDLSDAALRLTPQGVQAVLGSPQFPAMAQAYRDRAITPEEVNALTVYLDVVAKAPKAPGQHPWAVQLLGTGAGGCALLVLFAALAWRGRRRDTVNARLFARQAKSQ